MLVSLSAVNREDDFAVRGVELVDVTEEAVVVEEDFEEGAELTAIVAVQAEDDVAVRRRSCGPKCSSLNPSRFAASQTLLKNWLKIAPDMGRPGS